MAPNFVICYICGRKYGTQSIIIHEKTCLEKFRRDNEALPSNLRRAEPKRPQAMQGVLVEQTIIGVGGPSRGGAVGVNLDKLNQEAFSSFQGTLVACPNCGRTFLPDRLEVHQRACNSLGGQTFAKKREPQGNASSGPAAARHAYQVRLKKRPPGTLEAEAAAKEAEFDATNKEVGAFVTCKMCGKAFMGHSLAIHQAQCAKHAQNHPQPSAAARGAAKRAGAASRSTGGSRVAPPSGWSGGGGTGGGGGGRFDDEGGFSNAPPPPVPRGVPRAGPSSGGGRGRGGGGGGGGFGGGSGRVAPPSGWSGGGGGGGGGMPSGSSGPAADPPQSFGNDAAFKPGGGGGGGGGGRPAARSQRPF